MQEMAVATHTLVPSVALFRLRATLPFLIRLLSIYCCAHFSKQQRTTFNQNSTQVAGIVATNFYHEFSRIARPQRYLHLTSDQAINLQFLAALERLAGRLGERLADWWPLVELWWHLNAFLMKISLEIALDFDARRTLHRSLRVQDEIII